LVLAEGISLHADPAMLDAWAQKLHRRFTHTEIN